MLDNHQNKTICISEPTTYSSIKRDMLHYLNQNSSPRYLSTADITSILWKIYPCPFSSNRPELRPVNEADLYGVWQMPSASQSLRFPALLVKPEMFKMLQQIECDIYGYFADGEARNIQMGKMQDLEQFGVKLKCPQSIKDMEAFRLTPTKTHWKLNSANRIVMTRLDMPERIEEWESFIVTRAFTEQGVSFSVGDMLQYLRLENGNNVGAASQFRHLVKLAN